MVEYGSGIKVELFVLFNYNVKADRQSFLEVTKPAKIVLVEVTKPTKIVLIEVTKPIKIVLPGEQAMLVPLFNFNTFTNVRILNIK